MIHDNQLLAELRDWYTGLDGRFDATTIDLLDALAGACGYWSSWYADELGPLPEDVARWIDGFGSTYFRQAVYYTHFHGPDPIEGQQDPFLPVLVDTVTVIRRMVLVRGDVEEALADDAGLKEIGR